MGKARRQAESLADVKEGFNYLLGNRRLLSIVGLSYVVATFCAPYNRFVPIFATNILHVGASGFGVLMSAPGVGATVAALCSPRLRNYMSESGRFATAP